MTEEKRQWHKRHRDWEAFDRVTIETVPRYKTSGLSGDEWRISALVKFFFKGEVVAERSFGNVHTACRYLDVVWDELTCPIPDRVIELEKTKCDQPGCDSDRVNKVLLKDEYTNEGKLDAADIYHASTRGFCRRHLRRGDCGLEDSDRNYEILSGPGPNDSSNVIESPSVLAGVIELDAPPSEPEKP